MTRRRTVCLTWTREETLCGREREDARSAGEHTEDILQPRPADVCTSCWSVLRRQMLVAPMGWQ